MQFIDAKRAASAVHKVEPHPDGVLVTRLKAPELSVLFNAQGEAVVLHTSAPELNIPSLIKKARSYYEHNLKQ